VQIIRRLRTSMDGLRSADPPLPAPKQDPTYNILRCKGTEKEKAEKKKGPVKTDFVACKRKTTTTTKHFDKSRKQQPIRVCS